jgi:hypothetical protein
MEKSMSKPEFNSPATDGVKRTRTFFSKKHHVSQTGSIEAWLWRRWQSWAN